MLNVDLQITEQLELEEAQRSFSSNHIAMGKGCQPGFQVPFNQALILR